MARKVKVVNTRTQERKEITSSARVWGQLQDDLRVAGISFSDMKVTTKEDKTVLEDPESVLPVGDFTLFLTAGKVKSGK